MELIRGERKLIDQDALSRLSVNSHHTFLPLPYLVIRQRNQRVGKQFAMCFNKAGSVQRENSHLMEWDQR